MSKAFVLIEVKNGRVDVSHASKADYVVIDWDDLDWADELIDFDEKIHRINMDMPDGSDKVEILKRLRDRRDKFAKKTS